MRHLIEAVCVIVGVVVVFFICGVGPIFAGAMVMGKWQCGKYQEATGKATKYTGAECYVQEDGKWYAWTEYKNRLVTAGSMK